MVFNYRLGRVPHLPVPLGLLDLQGQQHEVADGDGGGQSDASKVLEPPKDLQLCRWGEAMSCVERAAWRHAWEIQIVDLVMTGFLLHTHKCLLNCQCNLSVYHQISERIRPKIWGP